jgi:hypothetical protein
LAARRVRFLLRWHRKLRRFYRDVNLSRIRVEGFLCGISSDIERRKKKKQIQEAEVRIEIRITRSSSPQTLAGSGCGVVAVKKNNVSRAGSVACLPKTQTSWSRIRHCSKWSSVSRHGLTSEESRGQDGEGLENV